jgi:predicted Fe-S protein YdhL (DUF1289 family)
MTRQTHAPFSNIFTPCVRNCCLDEHDVCLGCCRTLAEILAWRKMSNDEKTAIMLSCRARFAKRELALKNIRK